MLHYKTIEPATLELLKKLLAPFMVVKSLLYFDDAEKDPEPLMFEPFNWEKLKHELQKQVQSFS